MGAGDLLLLTALFCSQLVSSVSQDLPTQLPLILNPRTRCSGFVAAPPETVVILEGGGANLSCIYLDAGVHRPGSWRRLESDLKDCSCYHSGSILTFFNFTIANVGEYGCLGLNGSSCLFDVVLAVPPTIVVNQNITVRWVDTSFTISPVITGLPKATVTWSRNGEDLDPNDPRVNISSEGVLTVTDPQANDRGVYTVIASNIAAPDGVMASVNVFRVFAERDGPHFWYRQGADGYQVDCVITAWPKINTGGSLLPDFSLPVGSTLTYIMTNTSIFESTVIIRRQIPTCKSGSMFYCYQNSYVVRRQYSTRHSVGYTDCPPPLLPPSDVTVEKLGDSLTKARISWTPPPNASRLAGYRVTYNYSVIEFIGNDTSVIVPDLLPGFIYEFSVATVRFQGDMDGNFSMPPVQFIITVDPVVMLDQNDVRGNQVNDDLTISPTIHFGIPEATLAWSWNGLVLDSDDLRVDISSEGILTVTGVQENDTGVYTVTASNIAVPDGVMASVNVSINLLHVNGPTFTYTANDKLQVDCMVTGNPAPVTATLSPTTGSNSNMATGTDGPFHFVRRVTHVFSTCNSTTTYTCIGMAGFIEQSVDAMPTCPIPPLKTTTLPPTPVPLATVPSLPCKPRRSYRPVGVVVSLAVFAVCSSLLSVVLLIIAIVVYHKKASRRNRKIATSVMSPETTKHSPEPQVEDAELLDQKGEAHGAATPDAVTENKVHGSTDDLDQKGEDAHGAATPDAMTENKIHGSINDLSATSSVQSKHSFHGRLWSGSIASLDEPEVKCEHSFCRDDDHDHAKSPTVVGKSYDSTSRTHGGSAEINQVSENQPTKDNASPLAKMDTTDNQDRSILESNKNARGIRLSAKVYSSPDIVAKRRSMADELAKNSDSIALGQVRSSPTLDDQERSNLVSKDTGIQGDMSSEEPVTKRRPRAMTDDDSDGIAPSKGQDSSLRITRVFSEGKSELNTLLKKGAYIYSTTDVQDRLKDESHGMLAESSMFEERPPKDQSESDKKFDGSISEGYYVGPPTQGSCGFSQVAFSEIVQAEGTDSHSSRVRPYSSMAEVRPSLETESEVHSKSENELPAMTRLNKGRLLAWSRPESASPANYPRGFEKVSAVTSEEGDIKDTLSLS